MPVLSAEAGDVFSDLWHELCTKKNQKSDNCNLSDPKSVEHYGDRQQRARTHDLCKSNVQTIFCLEWLWIFTGYMDWTCWWQGFRDDIIILLKKQTRSHYCHHLCVFISLFGDVKFIIDWYAVLVFWWHKRCSVLTKRLMRSRS